MKKEWAFFVALIGMWMLLAHPAYAREAGAALEDTLTDHLASQEDVKWYRFEMSEPGDAELIIHGLQERWDGWTNHWAARVYGPDGQTVLAEGTVRGYNSEYNPPAQFSLLDLDRGTYYIRVVAASTSRFTTDSYRLELDRTYRSAQPFVNSSGETPYVIGTEVFSDRLISQDQVRWYAFEMAEPGDAILTVTGLQDHWDGYAYHWRCAIYETDRTSVITEASVRGYSKTEGPSILSAPGLPVGTYYVQMTSTSSGNPLMTTFTTDPYEMQLIRYYPAAADFSGYSQIKVFRTAGEVLWASGGTAFLKLYDGECYGALMKNQDGAIVPVLIGADEASVAYVVSSTGARVTAGAGWHYEPLGGDPWYYSESGTASSGASADESSLSMLYVNTTSARTAAEAVAGQLAQPGGPETSAPPKKPRGEGAKPWMEKQRDKAALLAVGTVSLFTALCLFNGLYRPSKKNHIRSI